MHRYSSDDLAALIDLAAAVVAQSQSPTISPFNFPRRGELLRFGSGRYHMLASGSGNWIVPRGVYRIRPRVHGPGGGGRGANGNGGTGTTTTFGGLLSATSGEGGKSSGTPAGGLGTGGDFQSQGGSAAVVPGGSPANGTGGGSAAWQGGNGLASAPADGGIGANLNVELFPYDLWQPIVGLSPSPTLADLLPLWQLLVPRFPFEFVTDLAIQPSAGAASYPWSGRGARGYGTDLRDASFGGGGRPGKVYTDSGDLSQRRGMPGGLGAGGGGNGNTTTAVGQGGAGGGFAYGEFDVTPGQSLAFTVGVGGAAGVGTDANNVGGQGGNGLIIIEF